MLLMIVFIGFVMATLLIPPGAAQAQGCELTIKQLNFPEKVDPGNLVSVTVDFVIICPSTKLYITPQDEGQTRLIDSEGNILSRILFDLPYMGGNAELRHEFNVTNTATAPTTPQLWSLKEAVSVFQRGVVFASAEQSFQIQVGQVVQTTSSQPRSASMETESAGQTVQETTASRRNYPLDMIGVIGVVVAVVLVGVFLFFTKRKKPSTTGSLAEPALGQEALRHEPEPRITIPYDPNSISTGYPDLDSMLAGGLPKGYAILIVSPPCDERDLLFGKIIESGLAAGNLIFFISRDLRRAQDLAGRYAKNFYVFSPQADRVTGDYANLLKISSVQDLSDLNISLMKATEPIPGSTKKIIILDILTDILLEHKALITRKWLDEFIAKRKAEGFTVLGTLNPLIASDRESQTIIDLFEGIIEIYERELRERSRRFLVVKKMYGRKYAETELMLDKDKLF